MNKQQAEKIAKHMLRKGATTYSGGRHSITMYTGLPVKKLTDVGVRKVAVALHERILQTKCRPPIELMHSREALEKLRES